MPKMGAGQRHYGVKRGRIVTSFGANLDAAYEYWVVTWGSVLVYLASGTWGDRTAKRSYRWLNLL